MMVVLQHASDERGRDFSPRGFERFRQGASSAFRIARLQPDGWQPAERPNAAGQVLSTFSVSASGSCFSFPQ